MRGGGANQSNFGHGAGSLGGALGGDGEKSEDVVSVRRKAERAMAEQRKADLELLEARRQQKKLNFLLTQTELYAHFMSKKMDVPAVKTEDDGTVVLPIPTDEVTTSILSRLETAPTGVVGLEEEASGAIPTSSTASSSLAKAAKAAAGRLGLVDDEAEYSRCFCFLVSIKTLLFYDGNRN